MQILRKESILEVATEEFSKYGYDAVSMNSLAAKLDINKATIYYHFKDKKSLYREVAQYILEDGYTDIEKILSLKIAPKEIFIKYIQVLIKRYDKRPYIISFVLREVANFGANIDKQLAPYVDKEILYLEKVLQKQNLKEKYQNMDIFSFYSLIKGTLLFYYAAQMSDIEIKELRRMGKEHLKILNHISKFIADILLDAICQDEK